MSNSTIRRRNLKRVRSLLITLALVVATNIAISYAGTGFGNKSGLAMIPDSPKPKSGLSMIPDSPRPKSGLSMIPDSPRPKSGLSMIPDSPRPKSGLSMIPDSPRP